MSWKAGRAVLLAAAALAAGSALRAFSLSKDDVFPRAFSPNGDGINDVVYFNLANPSLDSVVGSIYDAAGSPVADLKAAPTAGTPPLGPDALMWDGKDRNGNTVRAGIYIYKILGGNGEEITGTVVVAK